MAKKFVIWIYTWELHVQVAGAVVGDGFRFGYKQAGNAEILKHLGEAAGMKVHIADLVGLDSTSGNVRDLLNEQRPHCLRVKGWTPGARKVLLCWCLIESEGFEINWNPRVAKLLREYWPGIEADYCNWIAGN